MICSPFSNGRAASVAIGPKTILSAAHIFFDEGPWRQLLEKQGRRIRKSNYFEIDGAKLKEPKLQEVFLNLKSYKVRRMFLPLGWSPFPDHKMPNLRDEEGKGIPKKGNSFDLVVLELEEAHGFPILELNLTGDVGSHFTIVGFGPDKVSFEDTPRNTETCTLPIREKRVGIRENIFAEKENWEMTADNESVPQGRPGTTKGDSGGPLLDLQNNVIGIASFIQAMGDPNYKSGFTRLNEPQVHHFLISVYQAL